jgi:hypothetical protein
MIIVGYDVHTRFQQIAMVNPQTGELVERRLEHENGDAERFYATLPGPARVGMEATINALWFVCGLAGESRAERRRNPRSGPVYRAQPRLLRPFTDKIDGCQGALHAVGLPSSEGEIMWHIPHTGCR